SLRSSVSSPGMPNTYSTPSASRHSTKTSEALRSLMPGPYITRIPQLHARTGRAWGVAARTAGLRAWRGGLGVHGVTWRLRRAILVVVLAVGMALGLATSARAASVFYIRGGGDGHGIGMSQYGAYGYALHGKDYRFILAHYYTGTALGTTNPSRIVRVLLATGQAAFSGAGGAGAGTTTLQPAATYQVTVAGANTLKIVAANGRQLRPTFSSPLTVPR